MRESVFSTRRRGAAEKNAERKIRKNNVKT
jgi:hypothetical protein